MEALNRLNNVEKGKLLAGLFPSEMQGLIETIKGMQEYLITNEKEIRSAWDNSFLPAEFWYRIADNVAEAITEYGDKLAKRPRLFADQLFDGYNALFTIDCIIKGKCKSGNAKLKQAVELLFE